MHLIFCSSSGRKNIALVLCLLHNIQSHLKSCNDKGLDVVLAATQTNYIRNDNTGPTVPLASSGVGARLTDKDEKNISNTTAANSTTKPATSVGGKNSTNNLPPGTSLLQQRNLNALNEKCVFASLAKQ